MKFRNAALIFAVVCFAAPIAAQPKPAKQEIITRAYLDGGRVITISSDPETLAKCNGKIAGNRVDLWDTNMFSDYPPKSQYPIVLDSWTLDRKLEQIKFSENGQFLAAWDDPDACDYQVDGTVRLLDMSWFEDGSCAEYMGTFGGPHTQVTSVSFSADNKYLAACYSRAPRRDDRPKLWKPIRVFEVSTFNEVAWFTVPGTASNVQFSPDSKWVGAISTGADTSEFILWDFPNRRKKLTASILPSHDFRFTTDSATVVFADADVSSPTAISVAKASSVPQPYDVSKALDLFQPGFTVTSSDTEMILHHRQRDVTITVPVPPESSDPIARRLIRSADGEMALVGSTLIEFKTGKVRTMDSKRGVPPPPPVPLLYPAKP